METNGSASVDSNTKVYSCAASRSMASSMVNERLPKSNVKNADGTAATSFDVYNCTAVDNKISGAQMWEVSGQDNIKAKNNKGITVGEGGQWTQSDFYGDITLHGYGLGQGMTTHEPKIVFYNESGIESVSPTLRSNLTSTSERSIISNVRITAPAFFESSDVSLKEHVTVISDSKASAAATIPLYEFDWKSTGLHSYGTIAQEVEKLMPELVATDVEGKKSVNYIALLCAKVAALEKRVAELEAKQR